MAKKALVFSDDGVIMALEMAKNIYSEGESDPDSTLGTIEKQAKKDLALPYVKSALKYMRKKTKNV